METPDSTLRRRTNTVVSKGDGTVKADERRANEPVTVSLSSAWRCSQVTVVILVIINVILALWVVVETAHIRRDVQIILPNITHTQQSSSSSGIPGMPRLDTVARMAQEVDAFRKRGAKVVKNEP